MPLEPRGASYYTDIVKSSAEANGAIGGATRRGGNAAPPRPSGALSSVVKNNIIAQIQFLLEDNMPGPPGPPGPAGPTGPAGPSGSGGGGSYTPINLDIWGGSPPATAEEAINRLAAYLYTRTISAGPLSPVPNNLEILTISTGAADRDVFIVKYATNGTPQWGRRIGGIGNDQGMGISSDSSGNVYVIGYAGLTISTGVVTVFAADGISTAFTLGISGTNNSGAFIVKYDTNGTPQWFRRIDGSGGNDQGLGIASDSSGNLYVTGFYFTSVIVFAADDITTALSLTGTNNDIFVVKYDSNGTPQWVRRIGSASSSSNDQGTGIAADSSGNVYVVGYNSAGSTSVFASDGTTVSISLAIAGAGNNDAFIVKYATDGTPQWARKIGGTNIDQAMGVSTDSSGNAYVTGYVTGTATVFAADGTSTAYSIGSSGNTDAFIVKYATDGAPQWVRRIGGTFSDQGLGIASDSSGNAYVTGYVTGTATVFAADGTSSAFSIGSSGSSDMFLVKYATDGTPQWVRRIGGTGIDQGMGVSTDSSGNAYVTGYTSGIASIFGADGSTAVFSINNSGNADAFIVKYNTSGIPQWVRRVGGTSSDQGFAIACDSSGNVYATGGSNGALAVFTSNF